MNNQQIISEGFASLAVDYVMALRIIRILWQDFSKTDAFKLGIIDEDGNKIKSPETTDEKSAYSPFMRLVFNLKKMLAKVPGGSTKIGSMIAAYAMMRESVEEKDAVLLDSIIGPVLLGDISLEESILDQVTKIGSKRIIDEDAPVNITSGATSAGTGGYDKPLGKKKIGTVLKRKMNLQND